MFSKEFFRGLGFIETTPNNYEKTVITNRMKINDTLMETERKLKFKVYDTRKELGTNIEYYVDNKLNISGYWIDEQDFLEEFK